MFYYPFPRKLHGYNRLIGLMGIRSISDLLTLKYAEKAKIDYNKFNT